MTVTDVPGFEASGISAGIKDGSRLDLALVATADRRPASAAGVFTSNHMIAAPVSLTRAHLAASRGSAVGVISNSGNANAATGDQGDRDAQLTCATTAAALGCRTEEVLVCSTGLIGYPLPVDRIVAAVPAAVAGLSNDGGSRAAEAIMTTDTVTKQALAIGRTASGDQFRVGGIAKGAAMLEPNMATMLAVITTDAAADTGLLQQVLRRAVGQSFNALTVDGAQSTNDTVLVLANGQAGPADDAELGRAVAEVCRQLARQMADDAEGSTKTVLIHLRGAASDTEAAHIARSIANCQLVKCSWYGEDPYWGRIASETGSAATHFDAASLTIGYGEHCVYAGRPGEPDPAALAAYMKQRQLDLWIDLGMGDGAADIVTTDLSHAYIDENMGTS